MRLFLRCHSTHVFLGAVVSWHRLKVTSTVSRVSAFSTLGLPLWMTHDSLWMTFSVLQSRLQYLKRSGVLSLVPLHTRRGLLRRIARLEDHSVVFPAESATKFTVRTLDQKMSTLLIQECHLWLNFGNSSPLHRNRRRRLSTFCLDGQLLLPRCRLLRLPPLPLSLSSSHHPGHRRQTTQPVQAAKLSAKLRAKQL